MSPWWWITLKNRDLWSAGERFVTVHLTEKGRGFIAEIFPRHVAAIVEEMGALTPSEQEELGRLCRKLGKREGV